MKTKQDSFQVPAKLATIVRQFELSDITASILARRGFTTETSAQAFLNPDFYRPALPDAIPDLARASERLQQAYQKKARLLIWGDIDTDGLTATALMTDALTSLGMDVHAHIPERHGIYIENLKTVVQEIRPQLLISCDTGSMAHTAANFAREAKIDFIVTDHHQLTAKLPDVYALVNPKRLPVHHPLENLSGVGVVFLLLQHLYENLNKSHELNRFLDFVALGLVADNVVLTADTRYLVQRGLQTLKYSKRAGVIALAEISKLDLAHVTEEDIRFDFAPRLNSFGRLNKADSGFKLLKTKDAGEARILAAQADAFNQKRRLMSRQLQQAIYEQVQHDPSLLQWKALVLENRNWEGGVIGAAANQIAEAFERPTVLLTSNEREIAAGSVRSFGGYNILAALESTADLLISYGGHEEAAGVSLLLENVPAFRRRFSNAIIAQKPADERYEVEAEGVLPLASATLDLARNLEKLAPFGIGNPRPIFIARDVQLIRSAKIGRDDQHRRLTVREPNGENVSVLWWNSSEQELPEGTFELAYQIAPVIQDGRYELQITFVDWAQTRPPEVKPLSQIQLIDCRESFNIDEIKAKEPSLSIWAEGYSRRDAPGFPLSELEPAEALLIYTAPPNTALFQQAIKQVKPNRLYIYGEIPSLNEPDEIIAALYALLRSTDAKMGVAQLAERLAQSGEVIQLGLENLAEVVELEWRNRRELQIKAIHPLPKIKLLPKFKRVIEETAAYRRYFRRAKLENLLE